MTLNVHQVKLTPHQMRLAALGLLDTLIRFARFQTKSESDAQYAIKQLSATHPYAVNPHRITQHPPAEAGWYRTLSFEQPIEQRWKLEHLTPPAPARDLYLRVGPILWVKEAFHHKQPGLFRPHNPYSNVSVRYAYLSEPGETPDGLGYQTDAVLPGPDRFKTPTWESKTADDMPFGFSRFLLEVRSLRHVMLKDAFTEYVCEQYGCDSIEHFAFLMDAKHGPGAFQANLHRVVTLVSVTPLLPADRDTLKQAAMRSACLTMKNT